MSDNHVPVLIVGGGPVGLTLALELNHHGVRCALIEPRTVIENSRPRAKTTSARSMELFRRLGVAEAIRDAAPIPVSWSNRVTFADRMTGPEITHIDGVLGLTTPASMSPEPGQQIPQGIVEQTLRDEIAKREGITCYWGYRAVEVQQSSEHATVIAENEHGEQIEISADWVAGADGPRSVVRGAMGAAFDGVSGGHPNVNVTFKSSQLAALIPHAPSVHYWSVSPEHPGGMVPLNLEGSYSLTTPRTEPVESAEEAVDIVRDIVGADIDVEVIALDPWQARMAIASKYRAGRLFVAGDAAHQNPPWGGHGFNTGVGDAVNLGWKLAAVVQGWAPERLLDSYESERQPIAAQTIEIAVENMKSTSIELAQSDEETETAAERIQRLKRPEFHSNGLIFGYGYGPNTAAQAPHQGEYLPRIEPGNRLPHVEINGTPVFDLLGKGFTAIGPAELTQSLGDAARRLGVPFTRVDFEGEVLLVRPDQHLAWVGNSVDDPEAVLNEALVGFLGVHV